MDVNKVYYGDAKDVLETFPDKVIDMCVTSPPYWGLRDYGVDGQLGLEPSFEDYVDRLCGVFDEVKRVLKDGGTCWVNIGDSYASGVNNNDRKKVNDVNNTAKSLPANTDLYQQNL
ncbi:MAG: DNA methyltransferase [Methanobacterium sp.]